ncbi:TldD/PmbA family protein [bacterium]|nr:TldD/PmbA family protein [bacterium]
MEQFFKNLSKDILVNINSDEDLMLNFWGEDSHFTRFNQSKVRQNGFVSDATLSITLIYNQKTCSTSFSLTKNLSNDLAVALDHLNALRNDIVFLPEDPFIVFPKAGQSSSQKKTGKLLSIDNVVDSLSPAIKNVDLAGIWASGNIFIGYANSKGLFHWFSTDSYSFDYSLITESEKMVKDTFAGSHFNLDEYNSFMNNSIIQLKMLETTPMQLKPGDYRTYIAPAGVSDLLGMFSWNGLSEGAIRRGQSAFLKMKNDNVKLSPCFSLNEDFSTGLTPMFNDEGELTVKKLPLINDGVLKNTLINSRTAQEYNIDSNFAGGWEGLRSPVMSTGNLNEDEISQKINEGVFLNNLHYLNWSDNIGGRITGMTRYACFWIENGEIVAPIENMRFDDTIYNIFGDNLESVTSHSQFIPDTGTYSGRSFGGTECPGILLNSFSLTL